ncbi:MAG TPA: hypothetical protein VF666_18510 [Pyrinomonadaceae bacterium]
MTNKTFPSHKHGATRISRHASQLFDSPTSRRRMLQKTAATEIY